MTFKAKKGITLDSSGEATETTEAWNVAEGYVKIKILKPLIILDKYDVIARFGMDDFELDIGLTQNEINKRRVDALNRIIFNLRLIINNTSFAIKKADKEFLKGLLERINNVEEFKERVYEERTDMVTGEEELKINENLFNNCLKVLFEVKEQLNVPLNNAGLIFRTTDEVDLDKIMNDIIEGG